MMFTIACVAGCQTISQESSRIKEQPSQESPSRESKYTVARVSNQVSPCADLLNEASDDDISDLEREILGSDTREDDVDPIEPLNRLFFGIDMLLKTLVIRPILNVYENLVPPPLQTGLHNALANLRTPFIGLTWVLRGEPEKAGASFGRFGVNTLLGLGGLFDTATRLEIPSYPSDGNAALAQAGIDKGPYLYLPLLGSLHLRSGVGVLFESLLDPFNLWSLIYKKHILTWSRYGAFYLDQRKIYQPTIDRIIEGGFDPYISLRSAFLQLDP